MHASELFAAVWALSEIAGLPEGQKAGVRHFQAAYESNERQYPDLEPYEQNSATLEYLLLHSGVSDNNVPVGVTKQEFLDGIIVAFNAATVFVGNIPDGPRSV